MTIIFTLDDLLLGILIAAVVLLVKSLPLIFARVSFGYLAYWYVQGMTLKTSRYKIFRKKIIEDDYFHMDRKLNIYRSIRNSLKKNVGLYDESLASSFIILLFYLGNYFAQEISSLVIITIISSVIITTFYYWTQNRLYADLNQSILKEISGERKP